MRMICRILHSHHQNAIIYLDNILIFLQTLVAHKVHIEDILMALH